eukprot:1264724-Rhodomonas_salina.5
MVNCGILLGPNSAIPLGPPVVNSSILLWRSPLSTHALTPLSSYALPCHLRYRRHTIPSVLRNAGTDVGYGATRD